MLISDAIDSVFAWSSETFAPAGGDDDGGGEGIREVAEPEVVQCSLDKEDTCCLLSLPDIWAAPDEERLGRGVEDEEEFRGREGAL